MARHNDLGKNGEELAASWLEEKGFLILHRNWRHAHLEVDIIALRRNIHHFIEVKTVSTTRFGHPEEKVNKKKIRNLLMASIAWRKANPGDKIIQCDVLSISLLKDKAPEYLLIEDIYE